MKGGATAPDAELAVIGSAIIDKKAALRMILHLDQKDFYFEPNRIIFKSLADILEDDSAASIDAIVVTEKLRRDENLDRIGGPGYVARAINSIVGTSEVHIDHYCFMVKEASLDRQIDVQLRKIYDDKTAENVRELHDLLNAKQGTATSALFDFRKDLPDVMEEILAPRKSTIMSGFKKLDSFICGYEPGEVWTVGARTGGGKTAMMLRLMLNMAQDGHECLYLTTEMQVPALMRRILPGATKIDAWKFRKRQFNEKERREIIDVMGDIISALPITMLAKPRMGLSDIRAAVLRAKPKGDKPLVVFFDYLQRAKLPPGDNRVYQIEDFMVEFKTITQELQTLSFLGAQLDRGTDRNPSAPPVKADLRGSGSIEHESDGVMLLWKPPVEVAKKKFGYTPPAIGNIDMECIIAKGRECPDNVSAMLEFNGDLVQILDKTMAYSDVPPDSQTSMEESWR